MKRINRILCLVLCAALVISVFHIGTGSRNKAHAATVTEGAAFDMDDCIDSLATGDIEKKTVDGIQGLQFGGTDFAQIDDFDFEFTEDFTFSFAVKLDEPMTGIQVVFARDFKTSVGHFEIWIQEGEVKVYAPSLLGGNVLTSQINVNDCKMHYITSVFCGSTQMNWWYDNGAIWREWPGVANDMPGKTHDTVATFGRTNGIEDGFPVFKGFLGKVTFFEKLLNEQECLTLFDEATNASPISPVLTYAEEPVTINSGAGVDGDVSFPNFTYTLGTNFTISGTFNTTQSAGYGLLLAKGPKDAGHFEVFLHDGKLGFWSPDITINGEYGENLADGNDHAFCITRNGYYAWIYIDGVQVGKFALPTDTEVVSAETETFYLGSANGDLPLTGILQNIKLFDKTVGAKQAAELSSGKIVPTTAIVLNAAEGDVGGTGGGWIDPYGATKGVAFNVKTELKGIAFGYWSSDPVKAPKTQLACTFDIEVYDYDTDIETSLAGIPVTKISSEAACDIGNATRKTFKFDSALPAGAYVIRIVNTTEDLNGYNAYLVLPSGITPVVGEDAMKFFAENNAEESAAPFAFSLILGYDADGDYFDILPVKQPETIAPETDEPATDEPATDEPATDEPATDEPGTTAPQTGDVTVVSIAVITVLALALIIFSKKNAYNA